MRVYATLAACLVLTACIEPQPAVVSEFNGSTVKIQGPGITPSTVFDDEQALASLTCGKPARFASGRRVGDGWMEKLFICG